MVGDGLRLIFGLVTEFSPKFISKLPICGKLSDVSDLNPEEFTTIYAGFHAPIAELDCGRKCSPYNEYAIPFCCDIRHTVPTAYKSSKFSPSHRCH